MRSRELWLTGAVAGGVLLVLALLGAGLVATSGEITVSDSPATPEEMLEPPADGSAGVVFEVRQVQGGIELLGIRFRSPKYAPSSRSLSRMTACATPATVGPMSSRTGTVGRSRRRGR